MIKESRVNEIFKDCLFEDKDFGTGIQMSEVVVVAGITLTFGFNEQKVIKHKDEINSMLDTMNPTFKEGWSFLNLCFDKDNSQWTGSHRAMQELMCLGIAIDRIEYCTNDREFWKILPGGMPYIVIK